ATKAYLLKEAIPEDTLRAAGEINWHTDREHIQAVADQHQGWYKALFRLAEARLLVIGKQYDDARKILEDVRSAYANHRVLSRRISRVERALARSSTTE
ncbi:MAG: hypothetical protein KIS97_20915, partial [Nitrospira sp.]|nr:hypothetical protein [Nitrospira sp.]